MQNMWPVNFLIIIITLTSLFNFKNTTFSFNIPNKTEYSNKEEEKRKKRKQCVTKNKDSSIACTESLLMPDEK